MISAVLVQCWQHGVCWLCRCLLPCTVLDIVEIPRPSWYLGFLVCELGCMGKHVWPLSVFFFGGGSLPLPLPPSSFLTLVAWIISMNFALMSFLNCSIMVMLFCANPIAGYEARPRKEFCFRFLRKGVPTVLELDFAILGHRCCGLERDASKPDLSVFSRSSLLQNCFPPPQSPPSHGSALSRSPWSG